MVLLVQIFAAFVALVGLLGLLAPAKLVGMVAALVDGMAGLWVLWVAVSLRLGIGVLLLLTASASRFPLVFQIIGGISIAAAVAAVFIGQERIRNFVMWWVRKPAGFTRLWSLIAVAFGAFIYYSLT